MDFITSYWAEASLPAIELWATALACVYIVLAARNSSWCWPFAVVSSALWAYQVFVAYRLYFDAGLNVFYAVMATVGLWRWTHDAGYREDEPSAGISAMRPGEHLAALGGGVALSAILGVAAARYTDAATPVLDAVTTGVSVVGTMLLIERKLENWLYFLAADVVYVYLYLERGSLAFAAMFVVYTALSVVGYLNWRRLVHSEAPAS